MNSQWLRTLHVIFLGAVLNGAFAQEVQVRTDVEYSGAADAPVLLRIGLAIPLGMHVYADAERFVFDADQHSALDLHKATWNKPATHSIVDLSSGEEKMTDVYEGDVELTVALPPADAAGTPWRIKGSLRLQACDETTCFLPQTHPFEFAGVVGTPYGRSAQTNDAGDAPAPPAAGTAVDKPRKELEIIASTAGYHPADEFVPFLDRALDGGGQESSLAIDLGSKSTWAGILLILVGGLALNLTPCVLPMIPVNLSIIGVGTRVGHHMRGFLLGGAYGLGIALVYGLLGLAVVRTGATFGSLNASAWFNIAMAGLFVVLSLALFDVVQIDFSGLRNRFGRSNMDVGPFAAALVMGGISALLAGACVAPVVIAVLLHSLTLYSDGNVWGQFYPFVLGLGMALPWPIAGAGLAALPKPGIWMKYVKYAMAAAVLAVAGYYGVLGVGMLRDQQGSAAPSGAPQEGAVAHGQVVWLDTLDAGIAESRQSGKPILLDFWATWCKNCLAMERTTFQDPEVIERFHEFVLVKLQAEDPGDPVTQQTMKRFGVLGLPTYVVVRQAGLAPTE